MDYALISSRFGSPVVNPPNYGRNRQVHWSVALVRDVTSAFYANYHKRGKNGGAGSLLLRKKFHLLARMFEGKKGTYFKATRNRGQQASRYEAYLCNDCYKSLSKQIFEFVELTGNCRSCAQKNYPLKPGIISQRCFFSLSLLQDLCSKLDLFLANLPCRFYHSRR